MDSLFDWVTASLKASSPPTHACERRLEESRKSEVTGSLPRSWSAFCCFRARGGVRILSTAASPGLLRGEQCHYVSFFQTEPMRVTSWVFLLVCVWGWLPVSFVMVKRKKKCWVCHSLALCVFPQKLVDLIPPSTARFLAWPFGAEKYKTRLILPF